MVLNLKDFNEYLKTVNIDELKHKDILECNIPKILHNISLTFNSELRKQNEINIHGKCCIRNDFYKLEQELRDNNEISYEKEDYTQQMWDF
jgi:hypothetical protein